MDHLIGRNKYGQYCIPVSSKHRTVATQLLSGQVYEEDLIAFILKNRGNGAIVHAGAYLGDFLPALSDSEHIVYAFEAVRENYECAVRTIELNYPEGDHATQVFHGALGSKEGDVVKIITKDANGNNVGCASQIEGKIHKAVGANYEESIVMTIDSVVPANQEVSIIHLDVEGYEEEALKGAINTIRREKPILVVECWQPEMMQTDFYVNEIYALGYKEVDKVYENVILQCL